MIENDEKNEEKILEALPKEVLEDFKFFKKMDTEALFQRYKDYYRSKYEFKWEELKQAFTDYNGRNRQKQTTPA